MDIIFWSHCSSDLIRRYIGPYQLGFFLKENGYSYQVIDFMMKGNKFFRPVDRIIQHTERFITSETKAIGISATFFTLVTKGLTDRFPDTYREAITLLREKYPHIKFILGGSRVEIYPESVTSLFDAVVIGLAEDTLLQLMDFYSDKGPEPKFRRLLLHKTKFYYADDTENKKFDIQTCNHRWAENDLILPHEPLPIEIGRGCIFRCKFCTYALLGKSKYDYVRHPDCIRQEIVDNYEKFGTTSYYILDDTFNDSVQKITDFHAMTQTLPFKINYIAYLRLDLLHRFPETIPLLKESGLVGCQFGIESFHPDASYAVGKAWNGKLGKEFLLTLKNELWNNEILIRLTLISGIPEEPEENLYKDLQWLIDNKIHVWKYQPLMVHEDLDSEYARNATKYGFKFPDPDNKYNWVNDKNNWSRSKAIHAGRKLNELSSPHIYTNIWSMLILMMYGYDLEYIKNTKQSEFNKEKVNEITGLYYKIYERMISIYPKKDDPLLEKMYTDLEVLRKNIMQ